MAPPCLFKVILKPGISDLRAILCVREFIIVSFKMILVMPDQDADKRMCRAEGLPLEKSQMNNLDTAHVLHTLMRSYRNRLEI